MLLDTYCNKGRNYFSGARRDFISALPRDPAASILEIGCGTGDTGALALAQHCCSRYCAVELMPAAAAEARTKVTEVVSGDVERVDLPWTAGSFDALLMSEVLEHLVDPWAVLRRLRALMKPGAVVFSSSPNVSHHSVIRMLLRGSWRLTEVGIMDRTHLRWFTPRSYRELFEMTGYRVDSVESVSRLRWKARLASSLMMGRARYLFWSQINLKGHCA